KEIVHMSLEIIAKVLYSLPEQTGQGQKGPWVKQDVIVETEEQYPKKICMSAWGDMVAQFKSYAPGTRLKINFRVESREYNGRWYTDVRPWRAVVEGGAPAMSNATEHAAPMAVVSDPMSAPSEPDDLPF
ncbi:MAG: DUF3127 domain-containing protein, partial [Bacteroidota bacterium]